MCGVPSEPVLLIGTGHLEEHTCKPAGKEDHESEANLGYLLTLSYIEKNNRPPDLVQ